MLNFKFILNEKVCLKETKASLIAEKLAKDASILLPKGDTQTLIKKLNSYLSAAYLGDNGLIDDFEHFYDSINSTIVKLYTYIAIHSTIPNDVMNFYNRFQNKLPHSNQLDNVVEAIKLVQQNKNMQLSKAEQLIQNG